MREGRTVLFRRESGLVAALAAGGLVAGVAAKIADQSSSGWLADLGSYRAVWVLALVLIGRFAPDWRAASIRGSVFFGAMILAYYGWAIGVYGFGWGPGLYGFVALWLTLAVTAVPALVALCRWATRAEGWLPGATLAAFAGLILSDESLVRIWLKMRGILPDYVPGRPVQAAVELAVAAVIVVALPQHRSTRAWAVAMAVPMAYLAHRLMGVVELGFMFN